MPEGKCQTSVTFRDWEDERGVVVTWTCDRPDTKHEVHRDPVKGSFRALLLTPRHGKHLDYDG